MSLDVEEKEATGHAKTKREPHVEHAALLGRELDERLNSRFVDSPKPRPNPGKFQSRIPEYPEHFVPSSWGARHSQLFSD